ncbi:hypothetical protein [Rhodobacter capsulatus]|uniref:hypothetical protein n=1 Tax=Rhodobacter capsulatus TaxID=1061 RepID=UPI00402722E3
MTQPNEVTPSTAIPLSQFRQILHLPLSLLDPDQAGGPEAQMRRLLKQMAAHGWAPARTTFNDEPGPHSYEEAAYFHDFVRDFLYAKDRDNQHYSFCRPDMIDQEMVFHLGSGDVACTIKTLEIDLFTFGVAILTLELVAAAPMTLARALDLIDHGRRAFPGFWYDDTTPGLCPRAVTLGGTRHEAESRTEHVAHLKAPQPDEKPALRLFPWWRSLLAPLCLQGEKRESGLPVWRHVLDERIPVMSFLALPDKAAFDSISEGDWFRIAAADGAGKDPMPFNGPFLRAQAETLFYDRHAPCDDSTSCTRHSFAGYHYALVGANIPPPDNFFENVIQTHFRSHYRRMNFIAQLEFAALLTFSRRVTDLAITPDAPDFRDKLLRVRKDFLSFTHRFLFTDVSNHLQAREMNTRLRASMNLDGLRADVEAELSAASDFALAEEQRDMGRSQEALTRFATLFLPATLATGFAGMNIVADFLGQIAPASPRTAWLWGLAELMFWAAIAYGIGLFVQGLIRRKGIDSPDSIGPLLRRAVSWTGFCALVCALLAVALKG